MAFLTDADLKASGQWDFMSNRPLIKAQLEGEPLILTDDLEVMRSEDICGHAKTSALHVDGKLLRPIFCHLCGELLIIDGGTYKKITETVETNFGFYVDGFTLNSNDTIGEILVTGPQGNTVTVKSSVLTGFLERRLSPPNIMPLQDDPEGRN